MRFPIVLSQLLTPKAPEKPLLQARSWLLSSISSYPDHQGFIFLHPEQIKDPSLTLFKNIVPQDGGLFQLELGVGLPDLLPNVDGQPEFVLSISHNGKCRELSFSNAMTRLRYRQRDRTYHALVPAHKLNEIRKGKLVQIPRETPAEFMRTFSTVRFEIFGSSAEDAFEEHCWDCIHDMIERLNRYLKAAPLADTTLGRVYSAAYSRANLSPFYFILKGKSNTEFAQGWVSPHYDRTVLKPPRLSPESSSSLRDYLSGTKAMNDVQVVLNSAQAFLDGGITEYVLLLSVIAAEVSTQRFIENRLISSGVSKSKLGDADKELTYSLMLNVLLHAVTPDGKKPDQELLARMNRARILRNKYMHNGELPKDPNEVAQLFESTKVFVKYLREIV